MSVPPSNPAFSFPNLKPPSHYEDRVSYKYQWMSFKESISHGNQEKQIIFDLDWHEENQDELLLVGCTSIGEVCVWRAPSLFLTDDSMDDDSDASFSQYAARSKPIFRRKVSSGVLYSIQVVARQDRNILVTSGDGGVLVFDWKKDILDQLDNKSSPKPPSPLAQFKPYPSASEPAIEVNDVKIQNNHLFGAAGDAFGCYKWDLEQEKLISTYKSPDRGYLHTIELVPPSKESPNLMLTGGEDGKLGIWDTSKDLMVDSIDMESTQQQRIPRKRQGSSRWISSCKAETDWWHVAGGKTKGGYLSTWHAPTRSLVAATETCERPQQLAVWNHNLVSVANESKVSHWNPLTLERKQHVWCSHVAGYAVAVAPDSSRIAVSGVGSTVDLFEQGTQRTFRFTLE